jgi:anti-sigma factor (TIGR02949 family)
MRCEDVQNALEFYLDGELEDRDAAEFGAHLDACEACAGRVDHELKLKDCLRSMSCSETMPEGLMLKVCGAIEDESAGSRDQGSAWSRTAVAAMAVFGLGGVLFVLSTQLPPAAPGAATADASSLLEPVEAPALVGESIRWHTRPLPVEVAGPDSQAVGSWFRDKVDFPVVPPEFSRRAHLLGGRLSNVEENEAALLVYDVDGTKLSVIMFDRNGSSIPSAHALDGRQVPLFVDERSGMNVALHEQDGVTYTFTTDMPDDELVDLVNVAFSY